MCRCGQIYYNKNVITVHLLYNIWRVIFTGTGENREVYLPHALQWMGMTETGMLLNLRMWINCINK